jgi:hypothetical protein
MRIFITLMAFSALFSSFSMAGSSTDSVNGNRIAEPKLADYHVGDRTPGFSAITDIVNADGK